MDRDEAGYETDEDPDDNDGDCEDEVPDYDLQEIQRIERRRTRALEMGDLDATIERREMLNLGDEPNADEVDPWNCEHIWRRTTDSSNRLDREQLECHRCWREVYYDMERDFNLQKLFETDKAAAAENDGDKASTRNSVKTVDENGARPGVVCQECGVVYCNECKNEVETENKARWEDYQNRTDED